VPSAQTERRGDAWPVRGLLGGKPHRPLIEADRHRSKGLDQPRPPLFPGRRNCPTPLPGATQERSVYNPWITGSPVAPSAVLSTAVRVYVFAVSVIVFEPPA
jgi:hypothetical protein